MAERNKVKSPELILKEAIKKYNPIKVVLMFSGGHDSLVSSYVSSKILKEIGVDFIVYHGDTTIGIPETQDFVKEVCSINGWDLFIRKPPNKKDWYESIVLRSGFPGPTRQAHQITYRCLKERALRRFVTHELKSTPNSRENVLLITGIRQSESRIRMGYKDETNKDNSRVWCNPIHYWSEKECEEYMHQYNLPRNPVKDKICISGECLCGAFAGKEEYTEIKKTYPHVAREIELLHEKAKNNGFPWPWSMGPTEWYKNHPKGQLDMFMCVGCEEKRSFIESTT